MALELKVNGQRVTVDVPDDKPLLWVLREDIGLTGTKFGCGIAQCGACTVHIDGRVDQSCRTRISTVEGRDVVTIEGLSPDASHPLQEAWRELDVPQCGYCQAGQIMAASALLADNPTPTDAQIDRAMNRNLCRCGTYVRIREGSHRAAGAMTDDAPAGGSRSGEDDR